MPSSSSVRDDRIVCSSRFIRSLSLQCSCFDVFEPKPTRFQEVANYKSGKVNVRPLSWLHGLHLPNKSYLGPTFVLER